MLSAAARELSKAAAAENFSMTAPSGLFPMKCDLEKIIREALDQVKLRLLSRLATSHACQTDQRA